MTNGSKQYISIGQNLKILLKRIGIFQKEASE